MYRQIFRLGISFAALLSFSVGCGLLQSAAPPATPTPVPPPSTATQAAPATTGADSSGEVIKLILVPGKSEARYRVREQLASVPLPSDAIGATKEITGTIAGRRDGSIVSPESKFIVDLRTLKSDRSQRDNFLRRNVLETDIYPYATFVPTQAPGLPLSLPEQGQVVSFKLIGDLTIRNVTKQVTWDVTGQVQGRAAIGHATTSFPFEYFNLVQPQVPVVLSVQNKITLEVDVDIQPVGG